MILGSATGAITVNKSITKTSSLFVKNRELAWAQGMLTGKDSIHLAYWFTKKEAFHTTDVPIYRVGLLERGSQ